MKIKKFIKKYRILLLSIFAVLLVGLGFLVPASFGKASADEQATSRMKTDEQNIFYYDEDLGKNVAWGDEESTDIRGAGDQYSLLPNQNNCSLELSSDLIEKEGEFYYIFHSSPHIETHVSNEYKETLNDVYFFVSDINNARSDKDKIQQIAYHGLLQYIVSDSKQSLTDSTYSALSFSLGETPNLECYQHGLNFGDRQPWWRSAPMDINTLCNKLGVSDNCEIYKGYDLELNFDDYNNKTVFAVALRKHAFRSDNLNFWNLDEGFDGTQYYIGIVNRAISNSVSIDNGAKKQEARNYLEGLVEGSPKADFSTFDDDGNETLTITPEQKLKIKFYQKILGYYTESPSIQITVNYLTLDRMTNKIVKKPVYINASSLLAQNRAYIETLLKRKVVPMEDAPEGYSPETFYEDGFYQYNVFRKSRYFIGSKEYDYNNKIVLEVQTAKYDTSGNPLEPFSYVYDGENSTGVATINYMTYGLKDLGLGVISADSDRAVILSTIYDAGGLNEREGYIEWRSPVITDYVLNSLGLNLKFSSEFKVNDLNISGSKVSGSYFSIDTDFSFMIYADLSEGAKLVFYSQDSIFDNDGKFVSKTTRLNYKILANGSTIDYTPDSSVTYYDLTFRLYADTSKQESMYNTSLLLWGLTDFDYLYDLDIKFREYKFNERNFTFTYDEYTVPYYNTSDIEVKRSSINSIDSSACSNGVVSYDVLFELLSETNTGIDIRDRIKNGYMLEGDMISLASGKLEYSTNGSVLALERSRMEGGAEASTAVGKATLTINYSIENYFVLNIDKKTGNDFTRYYEVVKYNNDSFTAKQLMKSSFVSKYVGNSHRIESISVDDVYLDLTLTKIDEVNPLNSYFVKDSNISLSNGEFIEVSVVITDELLISFDYFTPYIDNNGVVTPFAVKTSVKNLPVKISSFEDIQKPTVKELETVLMSSDKYSKITSTGLAILGNRGVAPIPSAITCAFVNGSFVYTIPYSSRSLRTTESDGKQYETKVPLMSYAEWSAGFSGNKAWDVEMLNRPAVKDGKDAKGNPQWVLNNTVLPSELYGLFAVVSFKEQSKNLNDWFSEFNNGGCVVEFTSKEVKGSDFYKFVSNNKTILSVAGIGVGGFTGGFVGAFVGGVVPTLLQIGCEIANDDNGTYYSYFLYLDGTSDFPFAANNGGDNPRDDDPSLKNELPVLGSIGDWFGGIFNGEGSTIGKTLKLIVGIVLLIVLIPIVIYLIKWFIKPFKKKKK